AAVALPFLVAIGGGWGFQSQAVEGKDPHSYVCGWTRGPAAGDLGGQVSASGDDAEQQLEDKLGWISNPDLRKGSGRVVGIRFRDVEIPKNSKIMSAKIQFTASAIASANAVTFKIDGEASDNAVAFAATKNNITARVATAHSVTWTPGNWNASDTGP